MSTMEPIVPSGSGPTQRPNPPTSSRPPHAATSEGRRPTAAGGTPGAASSAPFGGRLEQLMRTLTDLQRRIPASAQADEALQAEISRTQVAVQNLLSTDISSEPEFPASLPKGLARGLNLRPGNVMELLE